MFSVGACMIHGVVHVSACSCDVGNCVLVAVCLVLHFVEGVEGVGHGHCFREWTFVSIFQHLIFTGWKISV